MSNPIAEAREAKGMTQGQLAEALGLSSKQIVSTWERGVHRPSDGDLIRLCAELGIDLQETRLRLGIVTDDQLDVIKANPRAFLLWIRVRGSRSG